MRFITLSDHAGDMLRGVREERTAGEKRAEERYRQELAARGRYIGEARERRDQARADHRLLAALRWSVTTWRRNRSVLPQRPLRRGPSDREEQLAAGARGESEVPDVLGPVLDDSWVLLKGYRNPRGEIDYILLGSTGLFAVEVKNVNGSFRITPARWRYDKYDAYGNLVEEGKTLADRSGRPPHQQLAEPVQLLESFLARRGQAARTQPVVLLTHPRARIVSCADGLGAHVITSAARLLELVRSAEGDIGGCRLAEIERLIQRDHRFHADRRGTRRPDRRGRQ